MLKKDLTPISLGLRILQFHRTIGHPLGNVCICHFVLKKLAPNKTISDNKGNSSFNTNKFNSIVHAFLIIAATKAHDRHTYSFYMTIDWLLHCFLLCVYVIMS